MEKKETYIQIGVTSLRTPLGDFLPSVPLYIKTTESIEKSGLVKSEEAMLHEIARLFAEKHFETMAKKRNEKMSKYKN